jgi:hypothetical protein
MKRNSGARPTSSTSALPGARVSKTLAASAMVLKAEGLEVGGKGFEQRGRGPGS